jgi:hypothetical protein
VLTREFGTEAANDALQILQHVGLVTSDEDELQYRFAGKMFHSWYEKNGLIEDESTHDPEIYSRLLKINQSISDKYISAWQIYHSKAVNYSGVLVELRGVLEFLADEYAPDSLVENSPGFKYETNQIKPTLRQRLRYMVAKTNDAERVKEIVSDYNLYELSLDQLARSATMAHRTASGMAHDLATRDMAYRALKQWDSLLAQLIPAI